jgi:hypothetical protein
VCNAFCERLHSACITSEKFFTAYLDTKGKQKDILKLLEFVMYTPNWTLTEEKEPCNSLPSKNNRVMVVAFNATFNNSLVISW